MILADVGGDCYSLMESFDLGWEVMKEIVSLFMTVLHEVLIYF